MLGELNASHTGARYQTIVRYNVARLGVIFDDNYEGDGLKIAEIFPGSPLLISDPDIKVGDIITAVDGQEIKKEEAWYKHFIAKGKRDISVSVSKKGKKPVVVRLMALASEKDMLYRRWVRQREEMTAKLSGGKIGYVHIREMASASFREAYSKILGKYRDCDAVVVDTRYNGGGWLHDDLITLLGGEEYIQFVPRGQYIGKDPYNKWTKPSCVLVCEANYSDASIFPYIYQSLGIGKLVGTPVAGTGTAVWWETQVDESLVFGIPEVTSIGTKEGKVLENLQIEPDILVYNDPASILRGEDKQLEAAVKHLMELKK
jgi:C-terminal processing protease CtpA/Prc